MNQAVIRLDERRGRAPSLAAGSLVVCAVALIVLFG